MEIYELCLTSLLPYFKRDSNPDPIKLIKSISVSVLTFNIFNYCQVRLLAYKILLYLGCILFTGRCRKYSIETGVLSTPITFCTWFLNSNIELRRAALIEKVSSCFRIRAFPREWKLRG